jgi:hypothetical protein
MKRIIIMALLSALIVLPATATAKRVHRSHGTVGTITSFDATTGELVITTTKGRELSALVTDDTHIQCSNRQDDAATTSRHGDDDHGAGDDHGHHGRHGHHSSKCSTDDLVAGTVVRRARIDVDGDDAVWTKLKLA